MMNTKALKTMKVGRQLLLAVSFAIMLFAGCTSKEANVFDPPLGICTGFEHAELLASYGYSFLEPGVGWFLMPDRSDEEFAETLQRALDSPVPPRACNGFIPGHLKSVGPDAVHDKILAYAETAFRRAQMAGIEVIVFGSGGSRRIPEGFSENDARNQFVQLLSEMAPMAKKYDVVVAVEPLNQNEVNFINNLEEGARIVQEVGHKNIRLLADIYHMLVEGEGPEQIIKYGELIAHVHVAELNERAVPGTHDEDLSAYYGALREIGYKGMISIEGRWEDMALQAGKAFETIQSQL